MTTLTTESLLPEFVEVQVHLQARPYKSDCNHTEAIWSTRKSCRPDLFTEIDAMASVPFAEILRRNEYVTGDGSTEHVANSNSENVC